MSASGDCLGVCFANRQLFYACSDHSRDGYLKHVGCMETNVSPLEAVADGESSAFDALRQSLASLRHEYGCSTIRMLTPGDLECWSIFPRLVYEDPDERESHLSILMQEVSRSDLETTWHELSNRDFRLLMIRNRHLTDNYRALAAGYHGVDFVSEFELGAEWNRHTGQNGSYLTLHATPDQISVSSFLLGKLRGATYFDYDDLRDLPFLWSYHAKDLTWMNGYHEEVYVYGEAGLEVYEALHSFFRETGHLHLMNRLDRMQVNADEQTYGFRLESAFPAILLSLNASQQQVSGIGDS